MQQDSYDIFEPHHLNSQNIIQENYYESDYSEASFSFILESFKLNFPKYFQNYRN